MFVPVACSECGKPFQVPEAAIGKPTACPWCQAAVLALPVGAPAQPTGETGGLTPAVKTGGVPPLARLKTPTALPEPLPLDDEPIASKPRRRTWVVLAILLLVGLGATLLTIGVLRRKEGYTLTSEWRSFTPSDGSCAIDLLGRAKEDAEAAESGGRRYVSEGWYSGKTTWIAWRNLTTVEAQIASTDDAWHNPQLVKIFEAERDRLKGQYGGYVAKDGTIKFKDPLTREVRLEYPQGRAIERMIVISNGPRPRIYFIGLAGKRVDPDGADVQHFFDSFRAFD